MRHSRGHDSPDASDPSGAAGDPWLKPSRWRQGVARRVKPCAAAQAASGSGECVDVAPGRSRVVDHAREVAQPRGAASRSRRRGPADRRALRWCTLSRRPRNSADGPRPTRRVGPTRTRRSGAARRPGEGTPSSGPTEHVPRTGRPRLRAQRRSCPPRHRRQGVPARPWRRSRFWTRSAASDGSNSVADSGPPEIRCPR